MWRVLTGLRPMVRSAGSRGGARFFSSSKPKQPSRMAQLAKEYGWTATGVYLAIGCIDLPLSYLLVHSAGQERMEDCEIACRRLIGADSERDNTYIHKAAAGGKSLFLAEFGIAYILHKCLIVVRLPLVVALTPAVARKLGQWGFNVKRAVPTVDKNQLAAKATSAAQDSGSPALRRAAQMISKDTHTSPADVLKEAAKSGKVNDRLKDAAQEIKHSAESKNFGKPPSEKRRWFWFF